MEVISSGRQEGKKGDAVTYFDEGSGTVGQQQCAQLASLSFVLVLANPLNGTEVM